MIADLFSSLAVAVDEDRFFDFSVWIVQEELKPRTRSHPFQDVDLDVWVLVLNLWNSPDAKLLQAFAGNLRFVEMREHDLDRVSEVKRIRLQVLRRLGQWNASFRPPPQRQRQKHHFQDRFCFF